MKTGIAFSLIAGSFLGALAVAGGAIGTHALREVLSPDRLQTYQTAMSYMIIHSVLLIAISSAGSFVRTKLLSAAGILIISGVCIFSGSLVLLVLLDLPALGMITPLGGVLLIAGWICLGLAGLRYRNESLR